MVPVFSKTTTKFIAESFANNKELCGGPLEPCPKRIWKFFSFENGFLVGYVFSIGSVMAFFFFFYLSSYMAFMIKKTRIEKMALSKRRRTNKEVDQVNYLPIKGLL